MTFKEPAWLLLSLLPLFFLGLVIYNRSRSKEAWRSLVAPRLKKELVQSTSPVPFWISLSSLSLGFILLTFALAQPITGSKTIKDTVEGKNIYLAIDLSRSMLVADTKPDRLTAAKTAAIELVEQFPQDRIGVISFAGNAWIEAPLTIDHDTLKETILALNENSIPYGGSNDSAPLKLLLEEQEKGTLEECVVVLLSDGEFHSKFSNKTVSEAKNNKITVYTLGFGTTSGDLVPDEKERQGFFLDQNNRPVLSRINEAKLRKIARSTNGRYFLGQDYSFLSALKGELSAKFNRATAEKTRRIDDHVYQAFLAPALFFLFLSAFIPHLWRLFSFNTIILSVTLCLFCQQTAEATSKGIKKYEKGNFEEAIEELDNELEEKKGESAQKLQFSKGAATYKLEGYEDSLDAYSKSLLSKDKRLQEDTHYNLGNTLYRQGQKRLEKLPEQNSLEEKIMLRAVTILNWQDALDHYRSTLHLNQENNVARENHDIVKKALERLKEEQNEDQQTMQQQSQPQQGEGGESDEQSGEGETGKENLTPEQLKKIRDEESEDNQSSDPQSEAPEEGKNGEQQESKNEGGDEGEEQERAAGETEEEFARRILEENSDFETGELKTNRRQLRTPSKDW